MKLFINKKYTVIVLLSIIVAIFVYCSLINTRKAESVIPPEYLKQVKSLTGEWKVEKLRCLPRFSLTNKEGASESPVIGKKLIIAKNLDVTFDNNNYDIIDFRKNRINDTMSRFNLILGDAQSFGDDVLEITIKSDRCIKLCLLKDNTLLIQVSEIYGTDGFYVLERIKN